MKPSDPLLLADGTLHFGMYPAGKITISRHLATPGFPQSEYTVSKLSAYAGSQCTLQSRTGKYRGLQGNPCIESRIPAMRSGFPIMKTGFSL
jgi:hypothetical protein